MPIVARGVNLFSRFHSYMNMYTCAKFDPDRSSGSEAFPYLWIDDSLTPHAPRVSRGYFLVYVHSQMNMHMCAKFGPDRYSCLAYLPHVVWWPPNPLQKTLGARYVNLFSRCPFPDESACVCQIWSRLVQWFATGPSMTDKVSSVCSRCWRRLAQKHGK